MAVWKKKQFFNLALALRLFVFCAMSCWKVTSDDGWAFIWCLELRVIKKSIREALPRNFPRYVINDSNHRDRGLFCFFFFFARFRIQLSCNTLAKIAWLQDVLLKARWGICVFYFPPCCFDNVVKSLSDDFYQPN